MKKILYFLRIYIFNFFVAFTMLVASTPALTQTGILDVTFGNKGKVLTQLSNSFARVFTVLIQPDQKILAGGDAAVNNHILFALTRYNSDGSLDGSFGNGGKVLTSFGNLNALGKSMVTQSDGKLVLGGYVYDSATTHIRFGLARYNTNGSSDSSFGMNGIVITDFGSGYNGILRKIIIKPDGKFIAAGTIDSGLSTNSKEDFVLVQYKTNGQLDSSFGSGGIVITDISNRDEQCYSLALQEDGKIVAGGSSSVPHSFTQDFTAVRYETNGKVDSSFGANGHAFSNIDSSICRGSSLLIQKDGKIILAGDINNSSREDFGMIRFTGDGIPDSAFGANGKVVTPMSKSNDPQNYINEAYLQPDSKILLAGIGSIGYYDGDFVLLRYNTDGSLDNTFGKRGIIKTDFANSKDFCTALAVQEDGKIVLAGNVIYDPINNYNRADFALTRYEKNARIYYNSLIGSMFLDDNKNALKDSNEPFFNNANITTYKAGIDTTITIAANGNFSTDIDTGNYVTTATPYLPYYTVVPAFYNTSFADYFHTDSISFAVQPIPGKRDLAISIIPLTVARPGFPLQYEIFYKNQGTDTITNGTVQLIKNSKLNFSSASPATTSVNGDTLRWNFSNLTPLQTRSITANLVVQPPPAVNIGDTLGSISMILSSSVDLSPNDNTSYLFQSVAGSYDPNSKAEGHGGKMDVSEVRNGAYMQYTIRFQNTGSDTAFNIYIRDTLSKNLDWSTFQMISSSHNYQLTINDGKACSWAFSNINLVDSNTNELASHGYLVYQIKPKITVLPKEIIYNSAAIFFDYNLPVYTNTEHTEIESETLPLTLLSFTAKKADKVNLLQWSTAQEINLNYFEIQRSTNSRDFRVLGKIAGGSTNYTFTDKSPFNSINYYHLKMIDKDGLSSYSPIRSIDNSGSSLLAFVYPNPVKDRLMLSLRASTNQSISLQLISLDGRKVLLDQTTIKTGVNLKSINVSALQAGSYWVKIISTNKEEIVLKFKKL